MNARDELAKLMQDASKAPCPIAFWSPVYQGPTGYGELFADAILAAGYRRPRTITTAEELDVLPVDSVLKDRVGDIYERVENPDSDRPVWRVPGIRGYLVAASILLPATVLYEPEPQP